MLLRLILFTGILILCGNLIHYLYYLISRTELQNKYLLTETVSGATLLCIHLIYLSAESATPPMNTRGEIFTLFSISILLVYLLVAISSDLTAMGVLVVPVSLIFSFFAIAQLSPQTALRKGIEASQVGISWIHIFLIVFAYGAFSVSFLMSVGYLRAEHQLKKQSVDEFFFFLPSLEALDAGLQTSIWTGMVFLSAGMMAAIFEGLYQGTIIVGWFQDPNVLGAIITGLIYATIIYLRERSLFTNRKIAFLAIFGFILIGILFFTMNFIPQMHSFVR